jgi:hypothetical protein
MVQDLWMLASFAPILFLGSAVAFAGGRRRRHGTDIVAELPRIAPGGEYLPSSIESAERQLGMLLRRMRAFERAPYAFSTSRILDDAEFERCLDAATALSIRIAELTGGMTPGPAERERIRHQIVLSVAPKLPSAGALRQMRPRRDISLADVFGPDLRSA